MFKNKGPFTVLNVHLHRVTIEENSVPATVSLDRFTVSLTSRKKNEENDPEITSVYG